MTLPPVSREEFYERRDDRQRRLATSSDYQAARTAIVADRTVVDSPVGQRALLTAGNLLSRWSRTVDLGFSNADLAMGVDNRATPDLHSKVLGAMRRADPFGDFGPRAPGSDALILQVGPRSGSTVGTPLFASWAQGWEALGWTPGHGEEPSVEATDPVFEPSLQLAVCLGVAQLFKKAVGQSPEDLLDPFRWSLWGHERRPTGSSPHHEVPTVPCTASMEIGRVLQVGVGAVGSNVLYFLSLLDCQAEISLVDYDSVEVENLDRTLLFGWSDALPDERPKVEAAAERVQDGSLELDPFPGTWDRFVDERFREQTGFDVWLPLANENRVRPAMAMSFPPLMLHGSTSRDWGVYLGRHIPLLDYCLHCRFPEEGRDPTLPCGEGKPLSHQGETEEGDQIDPSLPFVSAAAAALVLGELLKLGRPGYVDEPNYVNADLHGSMGEILALRRSDRPKCPTCSNAPVRRWRSRIGGSTYAHLTPVSE